MEKLSELDAPRKQDKFVKIIPFNIEFWFVGRRFYKRFILY